MFAGETLVGAPSCFASPAVPLQMARPQLRLFAREPADGTQGSAAKVNKNEGFDVTTIDL